MCKPNEGKQLERTCRGETFWRMPIKTHFVKPGESYVEVVRQYVTPHVQPGDFLSISEKIISLCQQRVIYKKDMKISRLARFLSRFASTSSAGIGVRNEYKMQVAINLCGRLKVIWAAFAGGVGKLFGKKGLFYKITGPEISGLDGFYTGAFDEYADYGILLPDNPDKVCRDVEDALGIPCMLVDANDFSVDILGKSKSVTYPNEMLADIIKDNPAGNGDQLTPLVLIRRVTDTNQDKQAE